MYACNGILFNHESPIRGETFVTRKITRALARIALGLQDCLFLGNLDARRDWGHARDFVRMQWMMMLQQDQSEDFVIATGDQHSVREFVEIAARTLGIGITWSGKWWNRTWNQRVGASCVPMREFLHVDDMAAACVHVMELDTETYQAHTRPKVFHINVGSGVDCTIRELTETVAKVVGFEGEIIWDTNKPDGTPRKLLDVSRLKALEWEASIGLEDGLRQVYAWFLKNEGRIRGI